MSTYSIPDPILYGCDRSWDLEHLIRMAPASDLQQGQRPLLGMVLPSWQRQECWTTAMKIRFIEGIFLGLGTGYYVYTQFDWNDDATRKANAGLLLDGQQRLTALRDFVMGEFSVFDGLTYAALSPGDRRRRFTRVVFPAIEMSSDFAEDVYREVYDRLAFGGVPHQESERAIPLTGASEVQA